jgi:rhodanese-related sulfurtransferase
MTCLPLDPSDAQAAMQAGARLIDIRGTDEYAREHIPGGTNVPLDRIGELGPCPSPVIFHCRSGMRTEANAARLTAATGDAQAFVLTGGIDAWRAARQPTVLDKKQPIEIMRQVQIAAGALVLIGVLLGFLWSPALFGLSAFVGAGLVLAGTTGWCGMAEMLRALPWNRRANV